MEEARAYALKLAAGPPIAIQLAKQLLKRSETLPFVEALNAAQHAMTIAQSTEDSKEGIQALLEKRDPVFTGR